MINQAQFNGFNMHTVFGIGIESGLRDFLKGSELKEVETYDWPERDGLEYSLAVRKKQDVAITLSCWMVESSIVDFKAKRILFEAQAMLPGLQNFRVESLDETFKVMYKGITNFNLISSTPTKVAAKFNIELIIVVGQQPKYTIIRDGNG